MKKNLLPSLVIAVCLSYSLCFGDDGSTRRYAEFTGHGDLFLEFCLLEREDVQHELKMTAEQIAKVKHIWNATEHEIPGLVELAANYRKRQSDPAISASDKEKLKESVNSDVRSCIGAYQRKELSATLSANNSGDTNRLWSFEQFGRAARFAGGEKRGHSTFFRQNEANQVKKDAVLLLESPK